MPKPMPKGGFQKPKNLKGTLKRMFKYLLLEKGKLICVIFFIVLGTLCDIAGTFFLKVVIDDYIQPLIGTNPVGKDFLPLVQVLLTMLLVYTVSALSSFGYQRIMINVAQNTLNRLRCDLFNRMQDLPIHYFDTHTHGETMSRYTNDVDIIREALSQGVTQLISSFITLIGTFIMMLVISPVLTVVIVIMLFVMVLLVKKIGSKSIGYFSGQQSAVGKVNGYIEEMIEGQKVVKVFCHEEKSKESFEKLNEQLRGASTNAHTFANIMMPIMGNMSHINYAFTAIVGATMIILHFTGLTVGGLVTFLQYSRNFSRPITQVSQQFNSLLSSIAGAERIFKIIDEPVEEDEGYVTLVNAKINDKGEIEECEEHTGIWAWKHPHTEQNSTTYTLLKGDVQFENVVFSYDGKKTVLNDISLYAKPGQKIAFVGSTGAGKTTITNLINRFYELQEGKIRYDGINIQKIKKADLRRSLAMVLQDTHLFTGSVRENIAYGKLDATDEEIIAAAKLANAHSFITRLPEGYDTILTSDGANLSQGQRQLISIARAAVADPPVLILDEATSSIDTRTEALIEKGMDELMKGRTVFVIAHRLSTVRNSDAIMVLEKGKIIERGTHEELL
ncbi:MAG: ABC transporter ATP-binding protein/permease, partial [Clostridiales bacterium]|nr:ABC transporter ATP-binding protein/permease [Clostridiales bacterium]